MQMAYQSQRAMNCLHFANKKAAVGGLERRFDCQNGTFPASGGCCRHRAQLPCEPAWVQYPCPAAGVTGRATAERSTIRNRKDWLW